MQKKLFKNAIALTGGIATGKSTVCNILKLYGLLTIDADVITHKLLDKNNIHIKNMFGDQYVKDSKVLRKELSKIIFTNQDNKKKLENFIHPLIKDEIILKSKLFEKANKPYIIDIPLFFETKSYKIKKTIVVYTPFNIQVERLIKRDNININQAKQKIKNQMDIEKKRKLATLCIDNSSTIQNLQNEIEKIIKIIL